MTREKISLMHRFPITAAVAQSICPAIRPVLKAASLVVRLGFQVVSLAHGETLDPLETQPSKTLRSILWIPFAWIRRRLETLTAQLHFVLFVWFR